MNRFPLWKNILVLWSCSSRPCSRCRTCSARTKPCRCRAPTASQWTPARSRRPPTLKAANPVQVRDDREDRGAGPLPDGNGPAARQHRDREAMPNNVVALTLTSRAPEWLLVIGLKPMALGLDLRGGVHFLYQVDLNAAVRQYLTTYESDVRTQLREAKIRNDMRVAATRCRSGSSSPAMSRRRSRSFASSTARDQLIQLGKTAQRLIIDRADIDGRQGFRSASQRPRSRERQDFAIQQNTLTLRNRVNELGVAEAVVQRQGLDRILVQLPGRAGPDAGEARARLDRDARVPPRRQYRRRARGGAPRPRAARARAQKMKDGWPYLLRRDMIVSGDQLVDATLAVLAGRARRGRAARTRRARARCSTRPRRTSASRWPCCSSRRSRSSSRKTARW